MSFEQKSLKHQLDLLSYELFLSCFFFSHEKEQSLFEKGSKLGFSRSQQAEDQILNNIVDSLV
jgi:hypothetical protein